MVQVAPAFKVLVPPNEMAPAPSFAVSVPPQVFVGLVAGAVVVVSTTSPAGRVSVKERSESAMLGFGLLMVKVNNDVSPVKIGFALNALAITGGAITVRVS